MRVPQSSPIRWAKLDVINKSNLLIGKYRVPDVQIAPSPFPTKISRQCSLTEMLPNLKSTKGVAESAADFTKPPNERRSLSSIIRALQQIVELGLCLTDPIDGVQIHIDRIQKLYDKLKSIGPALVRINSSKVGSGSMGILSRLAA
jgi:hypothetical protein